MTRSEFTRKTKAAAFERSGGKCEQCGLPIKGRAEYDHRLPDQLGGDNSIANCQVLCVPCHKKKTAVDVNRIRKGDRQRDKATGAIKAKGSIRSRGFAKKEATPKLPMQPRRPLYVASGDDEAGERIVAGTVGRNG